MPARPGGTAELSGHLASAGAGTRITCTNLTKTSVQRSAPSRSSAGVCSSPANSTRSGPDHPKKYGGNGRGLSLSVLNENDSHVDVTDR